MLILRIEVCNLEKQDKIYESYDNAVHVTNFYNPLKTDSEIISDCLSFMSNFNERTIIFDEKNWNIDEAILLPSNTTVIVDGVMIKQNDEVFDNIFRGDNIVLDPSNPNGFPKIVKPISNIKILGKNSAKLEGPDVNARMMHPTMHTEQYMVGDYWGWRGFLVTLSRCSNFELAGFIYTKQRSWANSFDRCCGGHIHDLEITSSVKNGDGVNIRLGCNNIKIENIKGDTSDDLVAINSAIAGVIFPVDKYVYPLEPSNYLINEGENIRDRDIYNITVANIETATSLYSSGVALLSRHGHKIYNVLISDIIDANPISKSTRLSIVYTYRGYGGGYVSGDLHSIRINNIVSNSAKAAIVINDVVNDVWINKVTQNRADGIALEAVNMNGIALTNS